MPWPRGLVVKNGSKIRSTMSFAHADAGIGDAERQILAGRQIALRRAVAVQPSVGGLDRQIGRRRASHRGH